jgi:hypothetical protein
MAALFASLPPIAANGACPAASYDSLLVGRRLFFAGGQQAVSMWQLAIVILLAVATIAWLLARAARAARSLVAERRP